jgi:hypothetical protein
MIFWNAALLLAAMTGTPQGDAAPEPMRYAQLVVRQQIIVRLPGRPMPGAPLEQSIEWKEGKGPKCLPAHAIGWATLHGPDSVDFILRNNRRIRAKLKHGCPALDYYQGFYIAPSDDGMVCADRDAIRSRAGGICEISRFRTLTPKAKN